MKILFIRHGQTIINVDGKVHKVDDDAGLTELGKRQAQILVEVCKIQGVEAIYSSPEIRALETARIIGEELRAQPVIEKGLAERNWGDWSSQTWEQIKQKLETMSIEERLSFTPPKGESWEEMEKRLMETLNRIVEQSYKVVAVVTHSGAMRALMPVLHGKPKDTSFKYEFHNGSITIFNYEDGQWNSVRENDMSHFAGRIS